MLATIYVAELIYLFILVSESVMIMMNHHIFILLYFLYFVLCGEGQKVSSSVRFWEDCT